MSIQTIKGAGCFLDETISAINSNFAQNLSTSGTFTASGAVVAQSTLAVTGATTLTGGVTGAMAATGAISGTTGTFTGVTKSPGQTSTPTPITADGAINPHVSANYIFTKAGIAAMTLAAPTATTDDGVTITLTNNTTDQDTVTATGLFQDGAGNVNVATWPAHIGATLTIRAYQGKWQVISNNNVVMS